MQDWTRERAAAAFPERFAAMLESNRSAPRGEIVGFGHSLITLWETMGEDLAPCPVHNRGYGGAITPQLLPIVEEIVFPLAPKVVFLATGANDMAGGAATPENVADDVSALLAKLSDGLPCAKILLLSITPCPQAWEVRRAIQQRANALLRDQVLPRHPAAAWVDMDRSMVDESGGLIAGHFSEDRVHYNRQGYRAYAAALRPALEAAWSEALQPCGAVTFSS